MLSREAQKERNAAFWELFRIRMRGHRSSNGKPMNWINYPTDVKDVYVRMELDGKGVRFCFDIQPKDDGVRSILWEQMTELKRVMESEMGTDGVWLEKSHYISGRAVSRILWENTSLSFYRDEDTMAIMNWLEEKLLSFDRFYQEYKDILISLAD